MESKVKFRPDPHLKAMDQVRHVVWHRRGRPAHGWNKLTLDYI
jgi:hypothetical protein